MASKSEGIYVAAADGSFYSPFNLNVDPMERLLLVNFERDRDEMYCSFEAQMFDDEVNGTGFMVIAGRNDGFIDIYHQPGLTLNHKDFSIVGKGLAEMIERPLAGAHFDVTIRGVDFAFSFEDKKGRPVAVSIKETIGKPRKPFTILAPMGSAAENPPSLPLVLLYDFYFIRRPGTEVKISVGGRAHKPDSIPLILDFTPVYFLRYATDPFIVTWNASHDGPLPPLRPGKAGAFRHGDVTYDLEARDGHFEIKRMRAARGKHEVAISFDPPVPDVAKLREGTEIEGEFAITGGESTGTVSGLYQLLCRGDRVEVTAHPCGGWQHKVSKWSVRLFFTFVRLFRDWPKTYRWSASIDFGGERPTMRSGWQRIK